MPRAQLQKTRARARPFGGQGVDEGFEAVGEVAGEGLEEAGGFHEGGLESAGEAGGSASRADLGERLGVGDGRTLGPSIPPFTTRFGLVLANSLSALAAVTASPSGRTKAIATGPSSNSAISVKPAVGAARRASVFL